MKGNPEPAKKMFSHQDEVTLTNPRGAVARGWEQVAVAKHVTPVSAYVVEVERLKGKFGGTEDLVHTICGPR